MCIEGQVGEAIKLYVRLILMLRSDQGLMTMKLELSQGCIFPPMEKLGQNTSKPLIMQT
jgi:hypothetical protein